MYCNNSNQLFAAMILFSLILLLLDSASSSSGGGNQITLGAKFDPNNYNAQVQFVWDACKEICEKIKVKKPCNSAQPQLRENSFTCTCTWENKLFKKSVCVPSNGCENRIVEEYENAQNQPGSDDNTHNQYGSSIIW